MSLQNGFQTLHQQHINVEFEFSNLKNQILVMLKAVYGDTSREYRIVKLTNSPATVIKVMNHIAARTDNYVDKNIAVNI